MGNNNINQTITALIWFKTITVENEKIKRTLANLSKEAKDALNGIHILQGLMYISAL